MKKFIQKSLCLLLTSTITVLAMYIFLSYISTSLTGLASEVFYVIRKAERNSGRTAFILGDSVCNQIWPQNEDDEYFAHLGSNQAITACGTYLLMKEYLEHNPQTKEAYYMILPGNLANDMNLNYTYQYFVIPFCEPENMKSLEDETIEMLYEKFGRFFVTSRYVKTFLLDNNLMMKMYLSKVQSRLEKTYSKKLSPTSIIYLDKMRWLCMEHNVKFRVMPLPVKDIPGNHDWTNLEADIKSNGFEDIFGDFTSRITYYPEDWFRDNVHFKQDILDQHCDDIRRAVLEGVI